MKQLILAVYTILFFCTFRTVFTQEQTVIDLDEEEVQFYIFSFTNIVGKLKEITIPAHEAKKILGKNSYLKIDKSYDNNKNNNKKKIFLKPDLKTLTFLPWTTDIHKAAWIICDVYEKKDQPTKYYPRNILKNLTQEAEDKGYKIFIKPKIEFYIFNKNKSSKISTKNCSSKKLNNLMIPEYSFSKQQELNVLMHALKSLGINVKKFYHEKSSDQFQISIKKDTALNIADQIIKARYALRVLTNQLNYNISFMPKIDPKLKNNSLNIKYKIWDIKSGTFDKKVKKDFIAGNLNYIYELRALLNSSVNSYKKFICVSNREQLISNILDSNCDPYLAFCAILKTGLTNLKHTNNSAKPNKLVKLDKLNNLTLDKSLENLKKSSLAKELFTINGLNKFIKNKTKECSQFNRYITDWEIKKYFKS